MGKAKRRGFLRSKYLSLPSIKREDAVRNVVKAFKMNIFDDEIKDTITLFGIKAEELSEAGASYEELMVVKNII